MRGQLRGGTIHAPRGGVDQDVEIAEALTDLVEHALHVGFVGHVAADGVRVHPELPRRLGCPGGVVGVADVVDQHVRAPSGELQRNRPADPPPAASNKCEFSLEVALAHFSSVALTLSSTLPLSAAEIGQPSLAASAALTNVASSIFGTRPRTSSALETTLKPSPTLSKVTVALTFRDSGAEPAPFRPAENAIA